jgi:hypothetical protein
MGVDAGPQGFELLAMFVRPRKVSEVVAELRARADSLSASTVVMELIESGVLIDAAEFDLRSGWADPVEHAIMLHDHRRTDTYLKAIRQEIHAGDVVLDLGTGSGVLAVAAAQAGADHVYAIEGTGIGDVAQWVFEANGVADRVTLIRGWSTQVELPVKADVFVAEIIGSEPFDEDLLETTLDARARLLRAGARLIPRAISVLARPLSVPRRSRWMRRVDDDAVDDWYARYGIQLAPLAEPAPMPRLWLTDGDAASTWSPMGPATPVLDVDLTTFESTALEASVLLDVDTDGSADAVLVTFRAELADGITLEQQPRPDEDQSWASAVWFLPGRVRVRAGDRLRVDYRYRVPGHADGVSCALETRS